MLARLIWFKKKKMLSVKRLLCEQCSVCSCSHFPNWTFDRHVPIEMQHLCIRFLTTAEGRNKRNREQERKTDTVQLQIHTLCVNIYKLIWINTALPVHSKSIQNGRDEHSVLTLFICQHYFQTPFSVSITTKLGFPLRTQKRKSTQITQYNLYA